MLIHLLITFLFLFGISMCHLLCLFSYLQFTLERQRTAEKERLFLVYAKQWWREYLQIRPTHNTRLVKIFAQVCKFYEYAYLFFKLSFYY